MSLSDTNRWYIKSFAGFSGWLGALFFISFFTLMFGDFLAKNLMVLCMIGVILIGISYIILTLKHTVFTQQFALANIITGEALVIWVIIDTLKFDNSFWLIGLFLAILMWVIPCYMHRFLSAIGMSIAFVAESYHLDIMEWFLAIWSSISFMLLIYRYRLQDTSKVEAISFGMLFFMIGISLEFYLPFYKHSIYEYTLLNISFLTVLIWVAFNIIQQNHKLHDSKVWGFVILGILIISVISFWVEFVVLGLLLLIIGFWQNDKRLILWGITISFIYIIRYYYFLGDSLLDKAQILILSSIAFTLTYLILKKAQNA